MKKKILSLLLCIAMIFSLVPFAALAADSQTFTLTNQVVDGQKYLIIADDDNGNPYALDKNGSQSSFKATSVTRSNSTITTNVEDLIWTASVSRDKATFSNGGSYVAISSSNISKSSNGGASFSYDGTYLTTTSASSYGGRTTTYYLRYSPSNKVFKYQSSKPDNAAKLYALSENTSGGEGGQEDPTPSEPICNIEPKSSNSPTENLSIAVNGTGTIRVKNSSSYSAYGFTATINDASVAKFNNGQQSQTINIGKGSTEDFVLTGLKDGKTTITITNDNGNSSRKATINLTVVGTGGGGDEPQEPGGAKIYTMATSVSSGTSYLLVAVDSGTSGGTFVMGNEGKRIKVSDGKTAEDLSISDDDSKYLWTLKDGDKLYNASVNKYIKSIPTSNSGSVSLDATNACAFTMQPCDSKVGSAPAGSIVLMCDEKYVHCGSSRYYQKADSDTPVMLYEHKHSFTYEAEGHVLKATCSAGCTKGWDTNPLTLTLTKGEYIYDGNAKTVGFAENEASAWKSATGKDAPTITYTAKEGSALTGGQAINAGEYTAQATIDGEKTAQLEFTIGKADYDMSGITFSDAEATYDGEEHKPSISGTLPTGADNIQVTVSYSDGLTEVGDKEVTATFATESTNYNVPAVKTAKQIVNAKPIAKPTEDTTAFTYSGSEQTYQPVNFDEATMEISGNNQTNAGTYTVSVTPKSNYKWDSEGDCEFTWVIGKANYDMSGITFSDETVTFDGEEHHPVISGELPTGLDGIQVTVSYSDGQKEVGEKEVTATFDTTSTNYNVPEAMTAKQTVKAAYVAQIGEKQYEDLQAAFDAAIPGDTVKLLDNIALKTELTIAKKDADEVNKNVILDLAGKAISCSDAAIKVAETGALTVKDSSEEKNGTIEVVNVNGGVLTVKSGALNVINGSDNANLFIEGGTISAEVNVTSGNIVSVTGGTIANDFVLNNCANASVTGGIFSGEVSGEQSNYIKGGQFTASLDQKYIAEGYELNEQFEVVKSKPHTHSYGIWQSDDDSTHSRECECGEKEIAAHSFMKPTFLWTFKADGTVNAMYSSTCSVCGHRIGKVVDKLKDETKDDYTYWTASVEIGGITYSETKQVEKTYTVNFSGGTGGGVYAYGKSVTLKPSTAGSYDFYEILADNTTAVPIAYNAKSLTFAVKNNITVIVKPHEEQVVVKPSVVITPKRYMESGKMKCSMQVDWALQKTGKCAVKEAGLYYIYDKAGNTVYDQKALLNSGTKKTSSLTGYNGGYKFTSSCSTTSASYNKDLYVMGYVVYLDADGNQHIEYSAVNCCQKTN